MIYDVLLVNSHVSLHISIESLSNHYHDHNSGRLISKHKYVKLAKLYCHPHPHPPAKCLETPIYNTE